MTGRVLPFSIISCVLLLGTGCSSIMSHSGPYQGYYSGVRTNADMIKSGDMGWAMTPLLALDIPLSAVADTLLLPYDMYRSGQSQDAVSPHERIKAAEAEKIASGQLPPENISGKTAEQLTQNL